MNTLVRAFLGAVLLAACGGLQPVNGVSGENAAHTVKNPSVCPCLYVANEGSSKFRGP